MHLERKTQQSVSEQSEVLLQWPRDVIENVLLPYLHNTPETLMAVCLLSGIDNSESKESYVDRQLNKLDWLSENWFTTWPTYSQERKEAYLPDPLSRLSLQIPAVKRRDPNRVMREAAKLDDWWLLKLTFKLGAYTNWRNVSGEETALILACKHGSSTDVMKLLLERPDIDINLADENFMTALMWASSCHTVHAIKLLLALRLDIDNANRDGDTALILASRHNSIEAVRILLEVPGINVAHLNNTGKTASMCTISPEMRALFEAAKQKATLKILSEVIAQGIRQAGNSFNRLPVELWTMIASFAISPGNISLIERQELAATKIDKEIINKKGTSVRALSLFNTVVGLGQRAPARSVAFVLQDIQQTVYPLLQSWFCQEINQRGNLYVMIPIEEQAVDKLKLCELINYFFKELYAGNLLSHEIPKATVCFKTQKLCITGLSLKALREVMQPQYPREEKSSGCSIS